MRRKLVMLSGLTVCLCAQSPLYLGVLAEGRVRVAFEYRDGHWTAMPRDSAGLPHVNWTVALDGRKISDLKPGAHPPQIREGAEAFETWMGKLAFRPLVVISQPNFQDPDRWKPFRPPPDLLAVARSAFVQLQAPATCQGEPVDIRPENLQLVPKAYRSAKGDVLLALSFDAPKGIGDDVVCETIWLFKKESQFHHIGAGLTLLDAGDYDADGTSEIMFLKSGYNLDGYVLLNAKDASTQSFLWSYH